MILLFSHIWLFEIHVSIVISLVKMVQYWVCVHMFVFLMNRIQRCSFLITLIVVKDNKRALMITQGWAWCALLLFVLFGGTQMILCVMIEERTAKGCVMLWKGLHILSAHSVLRALSKHAFIHCYVILVVMNCACMNKVQQSGRYNYIVCVCGYVIKCVKLNQWILVLKDTCFLKGHGTNLRLIGKIRYVAYIIEEYRSDSYWNGTVQYNKIVHLKSFCTKNTSFTFSVLSNSCFLSFSTVWTILTPSVGCIN